VSLPPVQPPLKLRRVHRSLGEGGKAEDTIAGTRGFRLQAEENLHDSQA
jgi:hypothetical protein